MNNEKRFLLFTVHYYNTSVNFYRKIKSQTIEPAKVGSKTLKRSLKCCQNEWLSMKKCAEKSGLIC